MITFVVNNDNQYFDNNNIKIWICIISWHTEQQHEGPSQVIKSVLKLCKIATHIDGLVQDCSNSIANALELLQSCTKPSTFYWLPIIKNMSKLII